jgi:virulence factor Mce-like protein
MKREVKIGLFLSGAILILAVFIFIVGDLSTLFQKPGYSLYLYFDSAAGLEKNTIVKLAGVKIGDVNNIRLKEGQAEVTLDIDNNVRLRKGSTATVAALGLLGEKYIEILPGKQLALCQPGDTIAVLPSMSFDQLGSELVTISDDIKQTGKTLREIIGNEEVKENIKDTLNNISQFASDLKDLSGENKDNLGLSIQKTSEAIQNFDNRVNDLSQSMDEFVLLLKDTVKENRESVKTNLEKISELLNKAEKSLKLLDKTLTNINEGEGTFGKLVKSPDLYREAEKTIDEIKKIINPVSSIFTSANLHFEYFPSHESLKSYLSFYLWPQSSKFFMGQIVQDPGLDKFTFSLQGGLRWGNFSPRAGIIQSKVGAALDYYILKDLIKFSLESFDFNRHPHPHFRLYMDISASKYFYLHFGLDDFSLPDQRKFFLGLGLGI